MKFIKKSLRVLLFSLIMVVASIGLGIGAAILPNFSRQDSTEPKIELVENKEEEIEEVEEMKKK